MTAFLSALLTLAVFVACILFLAVDARSRERVMVACATFSGLVGTLFYGYAYAWTGGLSIKTIVQALSITFRTFVGVHDYDALLKVPLFNNVVLQSIFWIAYFVGVFASASALLAALGGKLMMRIRERLLRRQSLILVYGATSETLGLVRARQKKQGLVFVCESALDNLSPFDAMGGVVYTGGASRCASQAFLKTLGYHGERALDVYCVSEDPGMNLRYAARLREALAQTGVSPEKTSLFLLGVPERRASALEAHEGRYGYGSLFACERHELAARLAIRCCPPWTRMTFDDRGRATRDFRAVIVGFGQTGRAVLYELVKNGQMEGSAFHTEVFDPQITQLSGPLRACNPELLNVYDIVLHGDGAQSTAFYDCLEAHTPDIVVLCAGSERRNAEFALELERFFGPRPQKPAIVQCTRNGVAVDGEVRRVEDIDVRRMDGMAMVLNHVYCKGPSPEADWQACDPFSRASSRASADFAPAFLRAAGVTAEEALAGSWPPPPQTLENLARTEHLRWCAFHLVMGYTPMSEEEYSARTERFRNGEKLRVSRNTEAMTHACLVPWEDLDALSARENAATGKNIDYKAMDVANVAAIPDILRQARSFGSTAERRA